MCVLLYISSYLDVYWFKIDSIYYIFFASLLLKNRDKNNNNYTNLLSVTYVGSVNLKSFPGLVLQVQSTVYLKYILYTSFSSFKCWVRVKVRLSLGLGLELGLDTNHL